VMIGSVDATTAVIDSDSTTPAKNLLLLYILCLAPWATKYLQIMSFY
jgi:hypothetical protein